MTPCRWTKSAALSCADCSLLRFESLVLATGTDGKAELLLQSNLQQVPSMSSSPRGSGSILRIPRFFRDELAEDESDNVGGIQDRVEVVFAEDDNLLLDIVSPVVG